MSRYVDLDEKIKAMYFDEEHEEWNLKEETIESALNHVDYYNVFELIRCKDCKHMVEHKGYGDLGESAYTCEGNMGGWIHPDDFCSRGRRKDE